MKDIEVEDVDIRAKILEAHDIVDKEMLIEEWGVTITIRPLNGAQRAEVLNASLQKDGQADLTKLYPLIFIKSVRYPKSHKRAGERVFEIADRDALNQKSGAVIERVAIEAMKISGMSKEARDDLGKG